MGFLDSLVSFFRHPLDFVQHAVCENNPQSSTCNTLTALSQAMGGETPQRLEALSTFNPQPLLQTAPQPLTGCYMQIMIHDRIPPRGARLTEVQNRRTEVRIDEGQNNTPRETRVGCYIEHHEVRRIEPIRMENLLHRLDEIRIHEPHVVTGCYMTVHSSPDPSILRRDLESLRRAHHH